MHLEFPIKTVPVDNLLFYPPDKILDNSIVISLRFNQISTSFGTSELFNF